LLTRFFFPPTEIEDSLDAVSFLDTLAIFEKDELYQEIFAELSEPLAVTDFNLPSGLALNLRSSDKLILEKLFDKDGFKIKFALAYVENSEPSRCPDWITDIKHFLYPPKPRVKRVRADRAG
ncbi:hypothetical protein, partial [Pseudomonas sp. R62]|uniref:hypothetical protein n=1 Tax=Pseudomonas sp. R62 TaxID=1144884 RepID=UPI001EE64E40